MVKLRRFTLYRIMPIVLISVLLISICLCSNVFSPKPARAIVGEEFILPAFYGWLNASNVFINTYNSDTSDTQYLANGVAQTLLDVANAIAFLNVSTWTRSSLLSELASRTDLVPNDNNIFYFQLDGETSTLFDSATRQFIIDNSLSSDTSTPVVIGSENGYFLTSGLQLKFAKNGDWANTEPTATRFYFDIDYELTNGNTFTLVKSYNSNDVFYRLRLRLNDTYVQDLMVNSGHTDAVACIFELMDTNNDYFKYFHLVNADESNWQNTLYSSTNRPSVVSYFGQAVSIGYSAETGTIVQNPPIPNDEDDEYGYVGIPAGVGAGSASTGLELLQSMLDYERDKPYSSTSEYTYTISNEVPIQPEPEQPGMVELPLIGIQLPTNFSLNLRGIWYYVVQWVNSIRSWFSWMFGVFANLPYAMVVPIYATAVVVIVLGVYKRFFM